MFPDLMEKRFGTFLILSLFVSGPWSLVPGPALAAGENAVNDYAFAQKCYHSLNKSSAGGWGHCIEKFEQVVAKYPDTPQAQKAIYSVGRLSHEKYEMDGKSEDLERALQFYNRFLKEYPKDSMADDCLYHIAVLRFEKQGDRTRALRALGALLQRYPEGDRAGAALGLLKQIGGEEPAAAQERPGPAVPELAPRRIPDPAQNTAAKEKDFMVRTVVIDPGHGGNDPGARGMAGTKEAEVSLQIARKLAFHLKKKLGLNVLLTRTNNRHVSLEERTGLANRQKADLFISIHANAHASRQVRGIQTFYLNNATSEAARKLANRENKVAGRTLSLSERILTTMLQNANTLESRDLAHWVQQTLVSRLSRNYSGIEDLKVDTAIFQVLDGVECPSILVETSFITNPREEQRLRDSEYQWSLADGMTQGIGKYIQSRNALASSL
ncbi:MAG: N-acetylmuramoyl-L-alanine amidase [Deltaproteobacteria bacterium]|nr:N-acetylmuramoyl-L-alanine amidase [Deltaproteobacteria bacterium]